MHHFLRADEGGADIIAIQEPYIDYLGRTRALPHLNVIYPTGHLAKYKERTTRSILMVNKRVATNGWTQLAIDNPDITIMQLTGDFGTIRLFNMYLDGNHDDALESLKDWARTEEARTYKGKLHVIWLGDFNRHHPMWDELRNHHLFSNSNIARAQVLIDIVAANDLYMVLPATIPTLKSFSTKNYTRVDNVFCSSGLVDRVIVCNTVPERQPVNTDHFPIYTEIAVGMERAVEQERLSWTKVDWEEFRKDLAEGLGKLSGPEEITTEEGFWKALEEFDRVVEGVIARHVPRTKQSPYQRRWWNETLDGMKAVTARLASRSHKKRFDPEDEVHEEYRRMRQTYSAEIRRARLEKWVEYLEQADTRSVWDIGRMMEREAGDGGRTRIPGLVEIREDGRERMVDENEGKAEIFRRAFFPPTPLESKVPQDAQYPEPAWTFQPPTDRQIHKAVRKMKNGKATRPGTYPNDFYKHTADLVVPFLGPIYRATFTVKVYPEDWALNSTIVLRKPGKPDYRLPGAWRPVVLSNGHARLLNGCMADDITGRAELLGLIPALQFGARPGRSTTDSLHMMVDRIKELWREGKVVTALFMDVKGAFPSVDLAMLYHELRLMGVPEEITEWMKRRYANRATTLVFDDFKTIPFPVGGGEDQGDPFAGIGYILYAAGLLRIIERWKRMEGYGFMDDVAALTWGREVEKLHRGLGELMQGENGVLEWAKAHNCEFGIEKFKAVDLSRRREPHPTVAKKTVKVQGPGIEIGEVTVNTEAATRFLGVMIDGQLRWKEQHAIMVKKGQAWVAQFRRLARVKDGLAATHIRQLYKSKAIPRMLYAADVVLVPQTRRKKASVKAYGQEGRAVIAKLTSIQRQAAIAITGAMRTTATDVLDIHAGLRPMVLEIERQRQRAAVRLATLPESHPLAERVDRAARNVRRGRHFSPLHDLMGTYGLKPRRMEKRKAVRYTASWDPDLELRIWEDKDEAILELEKDRTKVKVFADGSGYRGGVGAAAVLYKGGEEVRAVRFRLGKEQDHEVYEGECVGLGLGMHLVARERNVDAVSIWIDNTSAIDATDTSATGPSHYLLDLFHSLLLTARAKNPGLRVVISWVPGHTGVEGNERADAEAKRAAATRSSRRSELPQQLHKPLPRSRTAAIRTFRAELDRQHDRLWRLSPRFKEFRKIDDAPATRASRTFWKMTRALPRKLSSLLVQLRTGHIPLQRHLHRIQKVESPTCPCCEHQEETVLHFLMHCPAHEGARRQLRGKVGQRNWNMGALLSNPGTLTHLFRFIDETGRFRHILGDLPELRGEDEDDE